MKNQPSRIKTYLGIEGGATRSSGILMDENGRMLKHLDGGPCNLRLSKNKDLFLLWKQWKKDLSRSGLSVPHTIGVFLAGCRTSPDKFRIRTILKKVWPKSHYLIGNDSLSALQAALGDDDGIVVICGTGSIIRARRKNRHVQIGGWGHVGGDRGSGYWMGRELLRSIFQSHDFTGKLDPLTRSVLTFLGLNKLEELVQWSLEAPKDEIASLTRILFKYQQRTIPRSIIQQSIQILTQDVLLAAKKSDFSKKSAPFPIAISPSLAKYQPYFGKKLLSEIQKRIPNSFVFISENPGAFGAAMLALSHAVKSPLLHTFSPHPQKKITENKQASHLNSRGLANALTEQRNPRTLNLDKQSIPQLVQTMLSEEKRVIPAIRSQRQKIARVIQWITQSFKRGGRLYYLGAGTSGRLGVLDAAECPPTFGCDPEQIQGIVAGGRRALYQSVESAEDNSNYGRQAIWDRGIRKKDVVIGIAASGSTPFVTGGLEAAHQLGAKTVFLTFNPQSKFTIHHQRFIKIAVPTGPEIIAGSTRLKAGTATKLILNMFSTISMIRMGKVRENLMVDLDPSCEKLHDRSARIYSILKKAPYEVAWQILEKNGWNLKRALR